MRIFKFKYYNNLLGLNSRVAHFNMTVSEECTFCNLAGPRPVVSETFVHLFYYCNHVQNLLNKLIKKYVNKPVLTLEQYFLGNVSASEPDNIALTIVLDAFRSLIWQLKLEKKIGSESVFFANLRYILLLTCSSSKAIENLLNNSTITFVSGDGETRANIVRP
jgi:hypothetical protein